MFRKALAQTTIILTLLLFILPGAAQAGESWVNDPKTGAKIGFIHEFYTLSAASWTGAVVDGKAEGKGILSYTLLGVDNKQ